MTRIVAVADTHLSHDLEVPDGDVLVHAGDMLQHGSLEELARAAAWLRTLPHRTKVVVAGNHDVCLQKRPAEARALLQDAGFVYLEDSAATIDGLVFYGSPWQPIYRVWAFGARRGPELAAKWKQIPDRVDVLVTHAPPYGYGDRTRPGHPEGERRVGCIDLLARVSEVRPKLHLFGHIHQDPGRWERGTITLANVTTAEGERPASVLDLAP
jgi:Icc-related predicted phosphoesterase